MDYYCRYLHFILIVYITVYKASSLSYFSVYKAFIYMMLMENFGLFFIFCVFSL